MNQTLIDFINESLSNQWYVPKEVPDNLWETDWPFAPIIPSDNIDYNIVMEEMKAIDSYFVPHRDKDKINSYGHEGWYSVTVHGIDTDKTEHFDRYGFTSEEEANYHWTEVCELMPYTTNLIKSLPFTNHGRVRIMRLSPNGYIMPHTDGKGRIFGPFNFALNNPENCTFVFRKYGQVPFEQGRGFMLDIGNEHAIYNNSNEYRYHVIVHGIPTNNIHQLVKDSIDKL